MTSQPRFRFAPSPTGFFHVGGARTALMNWALARRLEGTFVLRIEDTDEARNQPQWIQGIIDALAWIGIDESGLCKKTPYLTKMGWFATPDSTKGAMALQKLIKQISCEVLSSNMPMDFYLAEMNVPDQAVEKTKVICGILSRNITIDVSVEDDNEATQGEDTA